MPWACGPWQNWQAGTFILGYSVEKNILAYGSQGRVRVPVSLGYGRQRGDISTQLTPESGSICTVAGNIYWTENGLLRAPLKNRSN